MYASDDGFVPVLRASLHSLLQAHEGTAITIHIAAHEYSAESIESVTDLVEQFGQTVNINPTDNMLADFDDVQAGRFSLSTFSRLLIDSTLPVEVSRVIYLDCDTLILRNLAPLWNIDLEGNVVGAVNDCRNWRYLVHLGLPKDAAYYNAGVLLVDVDAYRKQGWQAKFRKAIIAYDGLLEFPDNDLICMLMQNTIKPLPPEYNMIGPVRSHNYDELIRLRRPSGWYSRDEIENAQQNPAILHYTTFFAIPGRPWKQGYDEQDGRLFREHIAATGGVLGNAEDAGLLKKAAVAMLSSPLRPLALSSIGLVHGFAKPLSGRKARMKIARLKQQV
ncbi:MAG: glycosyltransferase family 8 protein [Leucobacter sp.]